ncbi:MAG: TetR family transcriptional regulator [Saprospiraceae bacterium]|jgi:AcrR family transcriptional regulator|nr:TetR family transcriptional regulator [Saprospiraceae bacterium]
MKDTKHEIVQTATQLFNRDGFRNVALKQIAAELGISTGNLNYHFPKKDDLMPAVFEQMDAEAAEMLNKLRAYPDLKSIMEQVSIFYEFQLKFRFFYLDTLEIIRAYPQIAAAHKEFSMRSMRHIRATIDYCVGRGVFRQEPFPRAYDFLAHSIWMHAAFWLAQFAVLQKDCTSQEIFVQSLLGLLHPYLTPAGLEELPIMGSPDFSKII